MATVRKSKKKKIITIICIILVIAILATAATVYAIDSKIPQVNLYTIGTSDIYESINATGSVSAGAVKDYKVGTVAVVKEVFVNVGDEVKKGDILATFDTSNYDEQIKSMQESYKQAKASYNDAVASQKEAKSNLAKVNAQIAELEKEISELEKKIADSIESVMPSEQPTLPAEQPTLPSELPTLPSEWPTLPSEFPTLPAETPTLPSELPTLPSEFPTLSSEQTSRPSNETFADAITQLNEIINGLSNDPRVNGVILSIVLETVAKEVRNGNTSGDSIAKAVDTAVTNAAEQGIIDADKLTVDIDTAVKSIREAVAGINWGGMTQQPGGNGTVQSGTNSNNSQSVTNNNTTQSATNNNTSQSVTGGNIAQSVTDSDVLGALAGSGVLDTLTEGVTVPSITADDIINSVTESDSVKLASDRVTLTACYAQKELYTSLASDTLVNSRKELMNTTKKALDSLKEARQQLADGWTAAFDGVVTACTIIPGEQTTLLSSGITIQNMDSMVVTISLGEYDIHKVKVDMPVTITSAYGTYSGNVISKAPVAGGGSSGGSIVDSLGSMMGMSGLSSLTDSGSGVEVKISVDNPDENIIVGFDAAVEIHIGEFLGVPTVPAESMLHDKNGTYVYLYNEEEGTVTKTKITTGAMSYTEYEITDGLKQGDRIIFAPQSTFEDTFEVKVSNQ